MLVKRINNLSEQKVNLHFLGLCSCNKKTVSTKKYLKLLNCKKNHKLFFLHMLFMNRPFKILLQIDKMFVVQLCQHHMLYSNRASVRLLRTFAVRKCTSQPQHCRIGGKRSLHSRILRKLPILFILFSWVNFLNNVNFFQALSISERSFNSKAF